MDLNLIDQISLLLIFTSLFLAIFVFTVKTKNKLSNTLIATFLVLNSLDAGNGFIDFYVFPNYPGMGMLLSSSIFLIPPFLYLYILSVIYSDFKFQKKHLLHFLPFLIVSLLLIPRYYLVSLEEKHVFLEGGVLNGKWEIKMSFILAHIQLLAYLLISFFAVKKYKQLLLENYSNASLFNYSWLFSLMTIFALSGLIVILKNGLRFLNLDEIFYYAQVVTSLIALVFIIWLVLKALQLPELFRGIDSKLQLVKQENSRLIEMNFNSLEVDENIQKLKQFMNDYEPFLDASISIFSLSERLKLSEKELSLLINRDLKTHFFDFINSYRINKAMEILEDISMKNLNISEIMYDVGFNSKSSFFTAFKKQTRTTPTQYRKRFLKNGN